jgi:hypothetical protein
MIPLFVGLTALNLLCLGVAAGLGYAVGGTARGEWHRLVGAVATLVCCGVHCVVFTYFAATAKWVQHAVAVKRLDPALEAPTRSFKAQAFPAALSAILVVLLAAFSGAAADNYAGVAGTWHHVLVLLALVINLAAAAVEYRAITRNGRLIDTILARIGASAARAETAPMPGPAAAGAADVPPPAASA